MITKLNDNFKIYLDCMNVVEYLYEIDIIIYASFNIIFHSNILINFNATNMNRTILSIMKTNKLKEII